MKHLKLQSKKLLRNWLKKGRFLLYLKLNLFKFLRISKALYTLHSRYILFFLLFIMYVFKSDTSYSKSFFCLSIYQV
ncbi:hypothetical protein MUK42_33005 [Musa troglodytarum]|uniref:Uncharacterized protein n=1 Tax=Musa troglodytarum TaxID=320322 RepID=A0A9E7HIT3_9LILI|nr:hypothetical protein MUK42_33005 [Musa troglodytarum]